MSWITNNEWLKLDNDNRVYWQHLGRFARHYRPYRRRIAIAALLALVGSLPAFLVPRVFQWLQRALIARDVRMLGVALLALLCVMLVQSVMSYLIQRLQSRISTSLDQELLLQYYRKLLNLSAEEFIAFKQRSNVYQRMVDAIHVTRQLTSSFVRALQSIIILAVVAVVIGTISLLVLGVLALGAAVLFAFVFVLAQHLRALRKRSLAVNYPLVGKMLEVINGLFTIKALSASVHITSDIGNQVVIKTSAEHDEAVASAFASETARVIRTITLVAAVGASFTLMLRGAIGLSDVLALYILANTLLDPVSELAAQYQSLSVLSVNVRNYHEVLDLNDEASEVQAALSARPVASLNGARGTPSRVGSTPSPGGQIILQDVGFAYRDGNPVLSGLNLEIQAGEKVSLVGRSGAGKTTLLRLLIGFFQPQQGAIYLDGIDIRSIADRDAYRRQFGVVSQQDFFFGTSIRENLVFGLRPVPDDDAIMRTLDMVDLQDAVTRLPEGLDAVYAEDLFSGGQKQRLFIARALLRSPSIVLLDEPTSALDFENEAQVMRALDTLVGDRTTITIAHRLSTVQRSNRVVVLTEGRVVASGRHEELYASNDYYRALCEYNSFIV